MKNSLRSVILGLSLAAFSPAVFAQHQPEHGAEPSTEHGEHGEVPQGFHNPGPMNLFSVHPDPVREEHAGRVEERPGPPPFVGPIINFAILLLLGYMALNRSINPALASRKAAVETEISEGKRMKAEAEAMHREYTERLEQLDREIATLKSEFVRAGEVERDRIIAEARTRADRARAEAAASIEQEIMNLRDELRREAVLAAASAAEEAVRKGINANDQRLMVDDFLTQLDAVSTPAAKTPGASA